MLCSVNLPMLISSSRERRGNRKKKHKPCQKEEESEKATSKTFSAHLWYDVLGLVYDVYGFGKPQEEK
jgi:hypothetical protein